MKKFLQSSLFLMLLLATAPFVARAATLDEILTAMPAQTTASQAEQMSALIALGPDAIHTLCTSLVPMGAGDDLAARYALSGAVKHCTRPGGASDRALVAAAIADSLKDVENGEVRAFLLQQLQFCGTPAEADAIRAQMNDPVTASPAVSALAAIGAAPGPMAHQQASKTMGDETGFKSIFDGESLKGWRGHRRGYTAENGELTWREGGKNIYLKKPLDNFILRFEFKLTPGANSGIGLRASRGGHAAYDGMEIQVLDDTSDEYKDLEPYQFHGSVYGVVPATRGHLKPVGEWNSQEIIADGTHIKVTLNGTVIVDADLEEAAASGTMDEKDHPGLFNESGYLTILGHNSVVSFRNLRVKEL